MRQRTSTSAGAAPLGSPTITIATATPDVHVHLPRAAVIWTDSDDATIATATGMSRGAFLDSLRAMEADPEHREHVFTLSRKRRGVEVDRWITFLRARFTAKSSSSSAGDAPANDAPPTGVDGVLAAIGAERVPSPRARKAGAR